MTSIPMSIYQRIADHAVALARFEASCDPTDAIAAKNRGETVTPEAKAEWDAANAAEQEAFQQLLEHVPVNSVEHVRKVGYLQLALESREVLDRDELDMFLHSLRLYRPRRA